MGEAEIVGLDRGMMEFRLGEIGHDEGPPARSAIRKGDLPLRRRGHDGGLAAIASPTMKRAVIGVPS
jgi:hypothetical protein